ncbi:MAG: hypothetical protein PWQ89_1653, partial [Verrucomicrobiota bacterium]|nr:hypothetical protein [Verrucomicrobiota bacterium]
FGPLKGANGNVRITGPCGDTMEFWVLIQDGRVPCCASDIVFPLLFSKDRRTYA